jgi:hypothetical protein
MADDQSAPATKQDLRSVEERLTKDLRTVEDRLTQRIDSKIGESEARILRHFDLTVETIRHDLLGANADEITALKESVVRIEAQVGVAPA